MRHLHIIQGGVKNGDKKWLERAAQKGLISARNWVMPKAALVGDEVVLYVGGFGFFATGQVHSAPKPRADWKNRYGAAIGSIRLIEPPISQASIQRHLPELKWANYPRSIHTPEPSMANLIAELIRSRRAKRMDLGDDALATSSLDELRAVALMSQRKSVTPAMRKIITRARSVAIRLYVLARASGVCEGCRSDAPFLKLDATPYLEAHHVNRLADDGPDHPGKVIALCPNCHSRVHHGIDGKTFNQKLLKRLAALEPE
jgi:5-methylcytosine-specific restriction endonuclease McrA